jgi:tetratricopeptide (TPR) repeat protein
MSARFLSIVILLSQPVFSAEDDITAALRSIYDTKTSSVIKKHIKLAIDLSIKGLDNSLRNELGVLSSIDPSSAGDYNGLLKRIISPAKKPYSPAASSDGPGVSGLSPIAGPSSDGSSRDNLIQEKFAKAYGNYRDSRIAESKAGLQEILEMDRDNSETKKFLAEIEAEKYLADDNKPFQSIDSQAMAYYRKEMYGESSEKLQKALEIDPANRQVTSYLNHSEEKISMTRSRYECEKMLNSADRLRNDGEVLKARKLYEKALLADSQDKRRQFYIQEFDRRAAELTTRVKDLFAKNDPLESRKYALEALEYDPRNIQALEVEKQLSMVLAGLKQEDRAKKDADRLYNKGVTFFGKGEYDRAIECWEQVLAFSPDHAGAKKNIEIARQKAGETQAGMKRSVDEALVEAQELFDQGIIDRAKSKCEFVLRVDSTNNMAAARLAAINSMKEKQDEGKVRAR